MVTSRAVILVEALLGGGDAHPLQHLDGAGAGHRARHLVVEHHALGNLVAAGEHRVQRGHRLLEHHGDRLAADGPHLGAGEGQQVAAPEPDMAADDAPGRCLDQSQDGRGGHALAAARLAHDGQRLARRHLE
jgi:hypothetical protein